MANREGKERNRANKGKTGPSTVNRRKKAGQKARPHASTKKAAKVKRIGR